MKKRMTIMLLRRRGFPNIDTARRSFVERTGFAASDENSVILRMKKQEEAKQMVRCSPALT
jgi:hypothetical protein